MLKHMKGLLNLSRDAIYTKISHAEDSQSLKRIESSIDNIKLNSFSKPISIIVRLNS